MKMKKIISSALSAAMCISMTLSYNVGYAAEKSGMFTDVNEGDWYFESAQYVSSKGYIDGVSENEFAPDKYINTKKLVSALYRMQCEADNEIKDIPEFEWAKDKNIISENDIPDAALSREKMAVMIYNYDKSNGIDTQKVYNPEQVLLFNDFGDVSDYAIPAMRYCIAKTIIVGNGEKMLFPKENATRAEAAAVIEKYSKHTPPDFSDLNNWAIFEDTGKKADVFMLCPLVDKGRSGNYNLNINYDFIRERFEGALRMESGLYSDECSVYAPYYRQYTLTATKDDGTSDDEYTQIAYSDVKRAFEYYLEHTDNDKPLIIAGFSQGSSMALMLLKEYFADEALSDRLIAAYLPGWRLTEDDVKNYPHLKPAQGETDTGVIITFDCEAENIKSSPIVPNGYKTYSINPLNWKTDSTYADKSLNKGACATDYSGNITKEIPNLTGAYIDSERGTLKLMDVTPEEYPGDIFEDGSYHSYDIMFFYRNIQENVTKRVNEYFNKQ